MGDVSAMFKGIVCNSMRFGPPAVSNFGSPLDILLTWLECCFLTTNTQWSACQNEIMHWSSCTFPCSFHILHYWHGVECEMMMEMSAATTLPMLMLISAPAGSLKYGLVALMGSRLVLPTLDWVGHMWCWWVNKGVIPPHRALSWSWHHCLHS